jgi:hypothetical protein
MATATAYNTAGQPYLFISFDAASDGNVVNQVKDVFNGLGQLIQERRMQSHSCSSSASVCATFTQATQLTDARPDCHPPPVKLLR